MVPIAYFGIHSSTLSLVIDLLILFLAILYLALIYWTFSDARRRIGDPLLVGCAIVASLFPFVGPLVYVILRPPEYLEDVHERELETRAAEASVIELERGLCPHCDYQVEPDFVRCPSCLHRLKERCTSCSRPLDPTWTICPYCEAEVEDAAMPAPSRSRRHRSRASEALDLDRHAAALDATAAFDTTAALAAEQAEIDGSVPDPGDQALLSEEDEDERIAQVSERDSVRRGTRRSRRPRSSA